MSQCPQLICAAPSMSGSNVVESGHSIAPGADAASHAPMSRALTVIVASLSIASCGPPLVWGGDEATRDRLLEIVPVGSTIVDLEAKAKARGWRISNRDDRSFPKGLPHYWGKGCEHQGGVSRTVIVVEYGLFSTSVETEWLFDTRKRLGSLCIRRTTDAP